MSEWKDTRLGDICTIVGRIGFRGYTAKDLVETPDKGAISLSPTNIANFELNLSKVTYISWEKYYESPEIMVAPGDIVFSKTGTVGWSALIKDVVHPITLNPQLVVFKDIKINPVYLSYVMRSHLFKGLVKNITGGSAVPTLTQKDLGNLEFPVADSETQEKIASILSSLDDKIAVNKKICENLEAQAQALFKHWFVDFAPFKDGKFVESELGLIPEGWRVGTLGDIAELRKPSIKPQNNILYTHYSIPAFDDGKKPSIDEGSTIKSNKFGINDGAVLLSKLNPSTKRIWYTGNVPENSVSSTEFLPFYSKNKEFTPFIYCYLNCDKNYREIANGAKGTTNSHQRIDANSILLRGLAYSEEVIRDFCDCCQNFMELILEANQESLRLASLRDTLLPRLMSGEISLDNVCLNK